MSTIVSASGQNVKWAGDLLRGGRLVSFPTETVYGLGANALNEEAILSIFTAKGRPLTDPLIVHVASLADAQPLMCLTPRLESLVNALAARFWPGPLTLVVPASPLVPKRITAGLDSVGIRIPSHPVALEILRAAKVPVAAPSANRFGHVSPTRAEHVEADLAAADVVIVDGGACPVGIESTILKLEEGRAVLLRRGFVTLLEVREALSPFLPPEAVTAVGRVVSDAEARQESQVAPGQMLTHYAPDVPAFLVPEEPFMGLGHVPLTACVVLDVEGRLSSCKGTCLAYRDLSSGFGSVASPDDTAEAVLRFAFEGLRWAEDVPGARAILLPDLSASRDERLQALADRFYRSASGRFWH